jgi:hypothetical protein
MSYSWGVGISSACTEGIPVIRAPIERPAPHVRRASPAGADMHKLAAALAPMVDVWRRLLAQHVPDGAGCCCACTNGTGMPVVPWPCSLHEVADLARRRHDSEVLARERMGNERVS